MENHPWLAEVLFSGLSAAEREHVLQVIGEATDAELGRLRARGAAVPRRTSRRPAPRVQSKAKLTSPLPP
jgi:hypothetical protein